MTYCGFDGQQVPFPIVSDHGRKIADTLGCLSCRAVFIIDPNHTTRLFFLYPFSLGRCFGEMMRSIDALQLHDRENVVIPAEWRYPDRVIVPEKMQGKLEGRCETIELPSKKKYMCFTTPSAPSIPEQ